MRLLASVATLGVALAGVACDRNEARAVDRPDEMRDPMSTPADNTKKNQRDADDRTLTPGDQGESEMDRTITQRLRQDLVGRDDLSVTSQNVKIITVQGVVTLRGPVTSDAEKEAIAKLALETPNVVRVDNQLEVAAR